jgi:arsenate reductase (thioredoxin)
MTQQATVLFVCVHNAGRSQMAAAFMKHFAGEKVRVLSAGTDPAETINPIVLEAMGEEGIDLSEATPELLSDQKVMESDYVITMGCGDSCPVFPGKTYRDWILQDPSGQTLEVVREIRNEIRERVLKLMEEIYASA